MDHVVFFVLSVSYFSMSFMFPCNINPLQMKCSVTLFCVTEAVIGDSDHICLSPNFTCLHCYVSCSCGHMIQSRDHIIAGLTHL